VVKKQPEVAQAPKADTVVEAPKAVVKAPLPAPAAPVAQPVKKAESPKETPVVLESKPEPASK